MTLKGQFKIVIEFFKRENFDYAVIGAFALYAYGYTRATRDIDFITRIEYQDKIIGYLESLGFETLNRSEGFSNHLHPIGKVRIDFVYIEGETSDILLTSANIRLIFEDMEIPVVSPEHLVALKLFAIKNDPKRKFRELADIKELIQLTNINSNTLRMYFEKYGLKEYYYEITGEKERD